jgi:hypothetical protein
MNEALRHLDNAIEALRRSFPKHMMIGELENCRSSLVVLHRRQITPLMFAEYREEWARSARQVSGCFTAPSSLDGKDWFGLDPMSDGRGWDANPGLGACELVGGAGGIERCSTASP